MHKFLLSSLIAFCCAQQFTGYVQSASNGLCLVSPSCSDPGCVIGLRDCDSQPDTFVWDATTNFLKDATVNFCIAPLNVQDTANIVLFECKSNLPGLKWSRTPGEVRFRSYLTSSLCLGTKSVPTVGLYQCDDSPSQSWVLVQPDSKGGHLGLSGGSIFLIFIVSLLAVYLLIGCYFQRKHKGVTGWESIPHYQHWANLRELVLDGCRYSGRLALGLCGRA